MTDAFCFRVLKSKKAWHIEKNYGSGLSCTKDFIYQDGYLRLFEARPECNLKTWLLY